ncbi:hypothetical protein [Desulfotalea psychrophila]|nr:hypothetical protein [Desulfotalea psychrophila]
MKKMTMGMNEISAYPGGDHQTGQLPCGNGVAVSQCLLIEE